MYRKLILFVFICASIAMSAQKKGKFDPVRFEADLEQFIIKEAALTQQETTRFLPVYRAMRKRQVAIMKEQRKLRHTDCSDAKACKEAIRRHDSNEIELKNLLKNYHNKFLTLLPAEKVFKIIQAEESFHRKIFKTNGGR